MLFDDITYKTNVLYNNKIQRFDDNFISDSTDIEVIEEPIIVMDTLHSCFSHAILDMCFPIYWILDDLVSSNYIRNNNVRIFIKKENILMYPIQNLPLINEQNNTYNGEWRNIIELLTKNPIIFEHLITKKYLFKQCFFYPDNDKWQRTPWNCCDFYPGRNVEKKNIRFDDDIIYNKLQKFRSHVFVKSMISNPNKITNELIIIDRKHNRKIDNFMLETLKKEASKNTNWCFRGVVILEDLTFTEQVQLFNKTRFFIFRHGSSLINLLWAQPNSVIFELSGGPNGITTSPMMYGRICKLTNSTQFVLNYDNYNPSIDIFDKLN